MYSLLSIRKDHGTGRQRASSLCLVDSVPKSLSKTIFSANATTTPHPSSPSSQKHNEPSIPRPWTYHIRTIWLFTFSDLKTIVVPKTLFGLSHALCLSVFLSLPSDDSSLGPPVKPLPVHALVTTFPRVLFWVWLNLLPFAINNQRQPAAILEDGINKPWRPMPSGRMTFRAASTIMFVTYIAAFLLSCSLGGLRQHLALIVLGFCYNDLGGADISCVTRNLINGLGFVCFGTGALEVALSAAASTAPTAMALWTPTMMHWQLLIAALVATSVHTQDMYDQEGDALRGRWTVPLSLGDSLARWTIAGAVPFWTLAATIFWHVPLVVGLVPVLLALTVAIRTLTRRSVAQDKATFRIWNIWVVAIYTLPLIKSFT